jgi:dihydrofolate reductase
MRELIYYVASTVDGFIAEKDGGFGFFPTTGDHIDDIAQSFPETLPAQLHKALGIHPTNNTFDAVLMGRGTYEVGLPFGVTSPYPHLRQYVISRTMTASPSPDIELCNGDPLAFVRGLKQQPGKAIWLCGGGILATALFPELDELIIKLNPILLGSGIPLFAPSIDRARLDLKSSKTYDSGVTLLRYRVKR